jgi:hypothetical protein
MTFLISFAAFTTYVICYTGKSVALISMTRVRVVVVIVIVIVY